MHVKYGEIIEGDPKPMDDGWVWGFQPNIPSL